MLPRFLKTLAVAALAAFTLTLSAPSAHANEPGNPAPTNQPATPSAPSAESPKPAARREDVEPTTLPAALAELKKARSDRDNAEAELTNANAATERTKQLLSSTLETCKAAQKERDEVKGQLATATKERDDEKAAHGKTKELLTLAEAAAGVAGVDPSKAIPASTVPAAKVSAADFEKRLQSTKDPAERAKITAEFEKAYAEGRVA